MKGRCDSAQLRCEGMVDRHAQQARCHVAAMRALDGRHVEPAEQVPGAHAGPQADLGGTVRDDLDADAGTKDEMAVVGSG